MGNLNMYIGTKIKTSERDAITYFYATDLEDAKKKAKSMNLKNFAPVSKKLYEIGVDY